jgi:hypothetical protein
MKNNTMEENSYNWKLKGLAKGVNPLIAAGELSRLQNIYGTLSPEMLVKEAMDPNSIFHPIFEWNDTKAAYGYRIQQARVLLNNLRINVISDGESTEISVYEVTCFKDGYKSITTLTSDDVEYVKQNILREMKYWKAKLQIYKEFERTIELINQAIETI